MHMFILSDFTPSGVELAAKRMLNPLFHIDFIWNLTTSAKHLQEVSQHGYDVVHKVDETFQPTAEVLLRLFAHLIVLSNTCTDG